MQTFSNFLSQYHYVPGAVLPLSRVEKAHRDSYPNWWDRPRQPNRHLRECLPDHFPVGRLPGGRMVVANISEKRSPGGCPWVLDYGGVLRQEGRRPAPTPVTGPAREWVDANLHAVNGALTRVDLVRSKAHRATGCTKAAFRAATAHLLQAKHRGVMHFVNMSTQAKPDIEPLTVVDGKVQVHRPNLEQRSYGQ